MTYPTKKLGEVIEINYGKGLSKDSRVDSGKYFAYGSNGPVYRTNESLTNSEIIVIGRKGTAGALYFISEPCWPIDTTFFAKPKNGASLKFIYYLLQTKRLPRLAIVTGVPGINRTTLANINIQLPPLEIQKQIVERLDKIVEAQKLNNDLIQKSDELFQSLLHKELNPAGKDWEVKKVKDVAVVKNGGTPSTKNQKYWNGKILWLTPKELSGFEDIEISDTERKISDEGLKHSSATVLPAGAVLLTSRAPIGYIAIAGVPMATNQGFKNFVCDSKLLNNEFLYFFLRLKTKYLQSLGRGATFTEISKTAVEKVEIPLPPLEIQKQIVAKLSAVQEYKTQLLAQKSKLKELFDSALHQSMQA